MPTPPDPTKVIQSLIERIDYLKHFSKDKPGWRFGALCVIKLQPVVIVAMLYIWLHR